MEKRKQLILYTIIKEHIKTGAPVGSGVLVDKYKLDISPATVRNEMAELENEGLITQPHTSAGRVPTEKAYSLFIFILQYFFKYPYLVFF
ncbi:DeoR family transcriptional regulator [Patescibacteria group bacterium]|nr:DeoR family transcriptional regulator [Patescibacteria group bacterium]